MGRHGVDSSSLASVGYSPAEEVLEVEFRNGSVYQYVRVPPAVFQALMTAESKGSYLNSAVREHYTHRKIISR